MVVFLGTREAAQDQVCGQKLARSIEAGFPTVVVVSDKSARQQQTPPAIGNVKAIVWPPGSPAPGDVMATILEALRITEQDRRIFISYRQKDAEHIAIQLHHELSEHRFTVFLDNFRVAYGEDIQERIMEALADMAFVLLLRSPLMHESMWVDLEITQALKQSLPIVVARWTNATARVPKLDSRGLPNVAIDPSTHIAKGILVPPKLSELSKAVEFHHADGLFRRRRKSIVAARKLAEFRNWQVVEEVGWKLALIHLSGRDPLLLGVTPRLAQPLDLLHLDSWPLPSHPGVVGSRWMKVLMQSWPGIPKDRRRLLEWCIGDRALKIALGLGGLDYHL